MFFSLLGMLLISHLLMLSDREHFWDVDKIAKQTEVAWDGLEKHPHIDKKELKGKRVLLAVHGFNNSADEAVKTYRSVANQIAALKDREGKPLYDIVIGYLWPGYDEKKDYFAAKKHALALKEKMLAHLEFLSSTAERVDLMAHSMGNRLVFEALNFAPKKNQKKLVQHFYSLAAAVDNDAMEKKHRYFHSAKNCQEVFIFHSKQDEVLEFLYTIAEWDKALGFEGEENLQKLPKNVQLVDCTSFISGHSQYFGSSNIYDFIREDLCKQLPSIQAAPNLKLLTDGKVEIISNDKK